MRQGLDGRFFRGREDFKENPRETRGKLGELRNPLSFQKQTKRV